VEAEKTIAKREIEVIRTDIDKARDAERIAREDLAVIRATQDSNASFHNQEIMA
jgi:hypothetical protein